MTTIEKQLPHRPYARLKKPERSVTEIIGLKAIDGLPWGAANETAAQAVYSTEWRVLNPDDAYNTLRRHFRGVWDSRAAIGTACHAVMEGWFRGESIDLRALVAQMAEHDSAAKSWRGHEDETVRRLTPYIDGLEKWWNEWAPEGGTSEDCIRHPGVYIGQRDRWNVKMADGRTWGLDLKTTAQQDDSKGVYGDSWALQLAAYRWAPECVTYGFDPKGKITETGTYPNTTVDATGVVHLRGDGDYTLYEVDSGPAPMEAFMHLAGLNTWLRDLADPIVLVAP